MLKIATNRLLPTIPEIDSGSIVEIQHLAFFICHDDCIQRCFNRGRKARRQAHGLISQTHGLPVQPKHQCRQRRQSRDNDCPRPGGPLHQGGKGRAALVGHGCIPCDQLDEQGTQFQAQRAGLGVDLAQGGAQFQIRGIDQWGRLVEEFFHLRVQFGHDFAPVEGDKNLPFKDRLKAAVKQIISFAQFGQRGFGLKRHNSDLGLKANKIHFNLGHIKMDVINRLLPIGLHLGLKPQPQDRNNAHRYGRQNNDRRL